MLDDGANWNRSGGWVAAGCYAQDCAEAPSSYLIIIRVAVVAVGVDIFKRVHYQAFVGQVFVYCHAVTAVAVCAAVLKGVNTVPLAFLVHRVFYFMAGDTRGLRWVIAALSCRG